MTGYVISLLNQLHARTHARTNRKGLNVVRCEWSSMNKLPTYIHPPHTHTHTYTHHLDLSTHKCACKRARETSISFSSSKGTQRSQVSAGLWWSTPANQIHATAALSSNTNRKHNMLLAIAGHEHKTTGMFFIGLIVRRPPWPTRGIKHRTQTNLLQITGAVLQRHRETHYIWVMSPALLQRKGRGR